MISVVLVSGWAMSAEVMNPLAEILRAEGSAVEIMSLADAAGESWDDLLAELNNRVGDKKVVLAGWSLGGNLCARFAAHYPEKVIGLVTMGSTPCFVASEDWPAGKHPDANQEFADAVAANMQTAMQGFAPVCARGSVDLKAAIRTLRASAKWALSQNTNWRVLLDRLAEDARSEWQKVKCPTVHLLAEQDPLTKPEVAESLQSLLPKHQVKVLPGSHAIFLDNTDAVVQLISTLAKRM